MMVYVVVRSGVAVGMRSQAGPVLPGHPSWCVCVHDALCGARCSPLALPRASEGCPRRVQRSVEYNGWDPLFLTSEHVPVIILHESE